MRVVIVVVSIAALGVVAVAQVPPRFTSVADLVALQVSVRDGDGRSVSGLSRDAFSVRENGRPLTVSLFASEDAPVAVGLLIDTSTSLTTMRERLLAGVSAFVSGGHEANEYFALTFNEHVRQVLPSNLAFTTERDVFRDALDHMPAPRGKTAFYDAIDQGLTHIEQSRLPRRFLLVISDGDDNASTHARDDVLARVRQAGVVVYGVALIDPVQPTNPSALKTMTEDSGGELMRPRSEHELTTALARLATTIRQTYTLGFAPSGPRDGRYHRVQVRVSSSSHRSLRVVARRGYLLRPGL